MGLRSSHEEQPAVLHRTDTVVYINLRHRDDRYRHIRNELAQLINADHRVFRIDATPHDKGLVGCCMSHIRALQKAFVVTQREFVCIFEDDFMLQPKDLHVFRRRIDGFWGRHPEANVLMLAINPTQVQRTKERGIVHVQRAQSASAYMIRTTYIPTIIACFQRALAKQQHLDLEWWGIQQDGTWYGLQPPLGIQRPDYSDIEKRQVNYGV